MYGKMAFTYCYKYDKIMVALIIVGIVIYLVIGRIIAGKKWEWDGYNYMMEETEIILTTVFWPLYLFWCLVRVLASIFVDIDW